MTPLAEQALPASEANTAPQESPAADSSPVVQDASTADAPPVALATSVTEAPSTVQTPTAVVVSTTASPAPAKESGSTSLIAGVPSAAEACPAGEPASVIEKASAAEDQSKAEAPPEAKASAAGKGPVAAKALLPAEASMAAENTLSTKISLAAEAPSTICASPVAEASSAAQVPSAAQASPMAKTASTLDQKSENVNEVTEKMKGNTVLAVKSATTSTGKRKASDDKTSASRKHHTLSSHASKKTKEAEEDETESEPEKQPKKRAKTAKSAKKSPKTPGRKKKVTTEPIDSADEEPTVVEEKVEALSDEIKSRFGQIVWAKMGGYPYWPCIITDPRLLPKKLQETAMKTLATKYIVFFYVSNNFAPVSFKKIVPWDDTKFEYRAGFPEKDSKAPKRRVKLMAAIEFADKEVMLPVDERANGLLKPDNRVREVETSADKTPVPVKRKPGRPPKAKPVVKITPKKTPKKRPIKEAKEEEAARNEGKDAASGITSVEEEEDVTVARPTLSKEEIKAKVTSRKTPKKKEADDMASALTASTKKASKVTAKQIRPNNSIEIDSKRKKEIELVVPHKSVKSADIREMTEEAAKKKRDSGLKSKAKKDKGDYNVGDLAAFANKMVRLHAKESSRNNDELVGMMQELFKEELMYRSDVERSGLAAIIALLRKSLSPTVGHTASALRKHMINILKNDTDIVRIGKKGSKDTAAHTTKKRKTENGSSVVVGETQPNIVSSSDLTAAEDIASSHPATALPMKNPEVKTGKKVCDKSVKEVAAEVATIKNAAEVAGNDPAKVAKMHPAEVAIVKGPAEAIYVTNETPKTEIVVENVEETMQKRLASPVNNEVPEEGAANDQLDMFDTSEHMDKNRTIFVAMLSKVLDQNGSKRADLASEIEAALFERFKESNGDYLTQARIIIFGLKENASMRKRLYSGALHCLEFAYADDAFFKASE